MLKEDADSGNNTYNGTCSNWASHIKSMLNNIGFSFIWLQQNKITIPLNVIKHRIYDSCSQSWYAEINNSNRLITYASYKHEFTFEKYLDFPFPDGDIPRSPSYGVYISQLIRFARVCSNVDDFNNRNIFLTAKLLKQGYRYHKIRKAFSKFYHRHSELIVKYNMGLKTLLQQGISEPIFYGDLVYTFKRIVGKPNLSDKFKKIVKRYKKV